MNENPSLISKGVRKIFLAEILEIIAVGLIIVGSIVSAVIIGVTEDVEAGALPLAIISLISAAAGIASFVILIVGYNIAGVENRNFKIMFWIIIGALVAAFLAAILGTLVDAGAVGSIFSILSNAASLFVTLWTITTLTDLCKKGGHEPEAAKGKISLYLVIIPIALSIILDIVTRFLPSSAIASILASLVGILELVGIIFYLVFLKATSKVL